MNERAKKKTAAQMVGVVVFMGAMAWASVPFYDWFCRVTGFGGISQVADSSSEIVLSETVKIRFDASLERDMPWEFKPIQRDKINSLVVFLNLERLGVAFEILSCPSHHQKPELRFGGSSIFEKKSRFRI